MKIIIVDLCMVTLEDFGLPYKGDTGIRWVVPVWATTNEPTSVVFNNFRSAQTDVRHRLAAMMLRRELNGQKIPDHVEFTINDRSNHSNS